MDIKKKLYIAVAAITLCAFGSTAQNLRSASNYSKMHNNLLAKQNRVKDQIRVQEAQKYAADLYEECEPEPDIYTEGWDSNLVNCYKDANVPNTKVLDVRHYVMPIKGNYVTSHYGYRPQFGRTHKGIDLRAAIGDTVYSAFSGRVRLTRFERGGYGFYVIVRHENGLETVYGHLSRFLVKPDQYVKAGQPIALSGNTGRSTGPHLHFETRFMGYAINPEAIFDFANRCTHTDSYTFSKTNYTKARDYAPSNRYNAAKKATTDAKETASNAKNVRKEQASATSTRKSTKESRNNSRSTYKVREGDNLTKIAAANNMSVAQLKKLNGLTSDNVTTGKVLRVK
ncbi:MAG: peptidoglycan DD-metalloendopeptidase family protein [Muribaculaceae bacterium]|jgi:LysM repeat protein|nr:peptidoglycan DD-metalloendopeptidase family protein [Muribaculaceae bacterium]